MFVLTNYGGYSMLPIKIKKIIIKTLSLRERSLSNFYGFSIVYNKIIFKTMSSK